MNILDTVIGICQAASEALDDVESRINELRNYENGGVLHIHVRDESKIYALLNGAWRELPPF